MSVVDSGGTNTPVTTYSSWYPNGAFWGTNTTNGTFAGTVTYSSPTFTYSRSTLGAVTCSNQSGSADGNTSPNCGSLWGVGGGLGYYSSADWWFYPAGATNLVDQFGNFKTISVDITSTRVSSVMTGPFGDVQGDCGLAFGFGSIQPTPSPLMNRNIPGRVSASTKDQFRIFWSLKKTGEGRLAIDAPVNSQTGGSYVANGLVERSGWMNDGSGAVSSKLATNGDYLTFTMLLEFDHSNNKIRITSTPKATNISGGLASFSTSSYIWAWDSANNTVDMTGCTTSNGASCNAGGFVLQGTDGNMPVTAATLKTTNMGLGLAINGSIGGCTFANMVIGK